MYKKMPPATATLRDSNSPAIGILKSSHSRWAFSERPCPSLPKTKHNGTLAKQSASPWDSCDTGLDLSLQSGWPASIFIWYSSLRASRWYQLPETMGIWKDAPRLARRTLLLNGSQQPGSKNTPPCCLSPSILALQFFNYELRKQWTRKINSKECIGCNNLSKGFVSWRHDITSSSDNE